MFSLGEKRDQSFNLWFQTAPVAELDQRCFVTLNDSAIELTHFDARQFSLTWELKKCEEKHAALS